jgi:ubiquinone/menaquinone biosynthesis C-methylase UbiE
LTSSFDKYADGKSLYGDDFSPEEIEVWFQDEREGYSNLEYEFRPGLYSYHALNWRHGFCHVPARPFEHVLCFGGGYGDELLPILDRAQKVTILEPSDTFSNERFEYVKPCASGRMPFADNTFDLVTCFGVLHHIPNVSKVVRELARCSKPGGWLLIREPAHSMGNWDRPRLGLTRRERGIPMPVMRQIVAKAGLQVVRERRCAFPLIAHLDRFRKKGDYVYNSRLMTAFDDYVSNLPFWSRQYHAKNLFQRLRPWSVSFVLNKPL